MSTASHQFLIKAYLTQRQILEKQFEAVSEELKSADPARSVQLEQQRDSLFRQIQEIEKKLDKAQKDARNESIAALIDLVSQVSEEIASQVSLAYQRTIGQRRAIALELKEPAAIINDLVGRIEEPSSPSYLHRFVVHLLLIRELPVALLANLRDWAEENITDLARLQQSVAAESVEREKKQDCLIIRIRKNHVKSTVKGRDRYFIDAWFVEDKEAYRTGKIVAKPVRLVVETADIGVNEVVSPEQTYSKEEIEATVRQLKRQCLEQYGAERPLIHIFLPIELMNLEVDRWISKEGRRRGWFGTDHEIVLRTTDRLDARKYDLKREWQSKWECVERKFSENAKTVFHDGVPVMDALYGLGQLPEVLAIKLTQSLSSLPEEEWIELFETLLLDTAAPLAFWLRKSTSAVDCCGELCTVLEACCLEALPETIRCKRIEVLSLDETVRDNDIRNHLSLLWDDAKLLPPKSEAA